MRFGTLSAEMNFRTTSALNFALVTFNVRGKGREKKLAYLFLGAIRLLSSLFEIADVFSQQPLTARYSTTTDNH